MYCTKCGKFLPEGTRFCTSCGAPVSVSDANDQQGTSGAGFETRGYYNAPQPDPYYAAGMNAAANLEDAPSTGFGILSFFFPLVGLILYLVWKDQTPLKAKSAGKGALIGVITGVVLTVLFVVVFGLFLGAAMTDF